MTNDEISLREYFTKWIETLEQKIGDRWLAHEETHKLLKEALDLAMVMLNEKLREMNNFREQQNQERGEFLPRIEYKLEYQQLEKRVELVEKAKTTLEGRLWGMGAVFTVLWAVIKFWPK